MQHKQICSRLITLIVILAQVLAGVSGALPAQVALAAAPKPPLVQPAKPSAAVAASAPSVAAPAAARNLEHRAAGAAGPELARPVAPEVAAAAPVAKPLAQALVGIGNRVWKDTNANGLQDSGEPGIPGVTVGLYDPNGNLLQCTQAGRYDTYRDEFSTTRNTNSNGTLDWSSKAWVQTNTAINAGNGNPGGALQVYGSANGYYATRAVDLSVFVTQPTLRFDYNMLGVAAKFNIDYSTNGGASFTNLAVLSDNNNGYKTITYTLPSNVANAQIRIAGLAGDIWAYFDNLTIQGQVSYPAIKVTDANGFYTLTDVNCVQPSTPYQVRIDTTQAPTNPLFGLSLTTANAGGVTSNDPTADDNDSDATTVTIGGKSNAVINLTSPATGMNNSYDFGFGAVSIGNYVWKDTNADGLQTTGEPGIPGVTVGLYDSSGNAVQCMQTGRYETYQDNFNMTGVNTGSDGTLQWNAAWNQFNAWVQPAGGNPGGSLLIFSTSGYYSARPVDLSVFAEPPVWRMDYNFAGAAASFAIQYSSDNGTTFQTLATLSDNNSTYKTITYTLPITVATAQIRIQALSGSHYVSFDNVTIRGRMRYPVTAVTDANGLYTFSGTECVQPNTVYQARIATLQNALFGLALTKPNAGGVTSNSPTADISDSDASGVMIYTTPSAVIKLTSPAIGANTSYAFGFAPSPVGALQVNKTVNGAAAPTGWQFALSSVNCPLPPSLTNPITTTNGAGGSVTFANLFVADGSGAACQYQIGEKAQTGWSLNYLASDPVNGVKVTTNSTTPVAVVNNQVQTCNASNGDVGGLVFQDFNMDGQQNSTTNEFGFLGGGIIVRAYGKNNQLLASAPLQADGSYLLPKLPNLTTDGVRIEFQNLAEAGVEPTTYTSAASTTNRTSGTPVRFVKAPTCRADLAVNRPVNYCQANPPMGVPSYYYFDPALGGNGTGNGGFKTFNYDGSGTPKLVANDEQIGATWGAAYQNSTKTIFAAAFTRTYVGYGPLGRGGIYAINLSNATPQVNPFVDLQTLGVNAGGPAVNPYTSPAVANEIGKTSLGDIDISEDGKTLYIMNLYQRELVLLDIASKTVTQKVAVPDPGCLDSRTTPAKAAPQDRRPWAIEVYNNQVYIGLVCSAETSQLAKDLHGYILRLQGDHFVPFYDFPMTASKLAWQPWGTTLAPLLADMVFDERGSLIVTLLNTMDFTRGTTDPLVAEYDSAGDIFKFANVNGQFAATPLYYQSTGHSIGGSAIQFGSGEVAGGLMDALGVNMNNAVWYDNTGTGALKRAITIPQGFNKGAGLGDLEILCDSAPLEIGYRVWNDSAQPNGVQDPNEPGIAGVIVSLYNITGTLVATTTTNAAGEYYFNKTNVPGGLKENTDYTIRIRQAQPPLAKFTPTLLDQVVNNALDPDEHDSDGNPATNAGYVTTAVHTGSAGQNDYSYAFGFMRIEIGNYVWKDLNANGKQDSNEPGIPGVTVGLYDASGNAVLCPPTNLPVTTLTDATGYYTFTGASCVLPSTAYQIGIDPAQPALAGFQLTTPNAGGVTSNDPAGDDSDSDASLQPLNGKTIALLPLTSLAVGANYSYDFGFVPLAIGNYVWKDVNADGKQDSSEPGIPGVTVGLYDASGNAVMCPQRGRYDTYLDQFSTTANTNSNGTLDWSSKPWVQTNTAISAGVGNPGGALQVNGSSTAYYATRAVDLSVFTSNPTFSFDYHMAGTASKFNIQYSNNGGASFTTLATLSDNNNTYKTITYTLPITVANAQIRIAGQGTGNWAYFDNLKIQGQVRYPVTDVTDANGFYDFTNLNCLQPNTQYQVRIDTTQTPATPLYGLFVTTPNAGGVTSNDPTADDSDSDASRMTVGGKPTAVINVTVPTLGANYSYDFGFTAVEIGNYVWKDLNADGKQDSGEPGIPGVTVGLYDTSGNAVMCPQLGYYDTYRDEFSTTGNRNSNGTLDWSSKPWVQTNTAINATGGNPGGALQVYGSANGYFATRAVDLSVFVTQPTLRFDYNMLGAAAKFNIQYSTNDGVSFTNLAMLSDNNNGYKTITYTLPSNVANAQIRIVGLAGDIWAYFDNLTIQGLVRHPVTSVTDANGFYTFTGANCVQPSTPYQVRIDTTQLPANPLFGLSLTTANAGGVTSNDPTADDSDSDASRVTVNGKTNAVINLTSPAAGANYSYDFGFIPVEIGNYVWKDNNANGLQDNSEPGIPGVTVGLYDSGGNAVLCPQSSTANLALNKTATQVSDYSVSNLAGNAVDGNTTSGMAITDSSANSWWQVDLGQAAMLRQVVLYARPGGAGHTQTEQVYVLVSNQPFASTNLATTLADATVWHSTLQGAWTGASLTVAVPNYLGRYVRIQHNNTDYLSLGEVQVFGDPTLPVTTITDSTGHYTFTGASCVQPSTPYQVRIDTTQAPLVGLFLTGQNAGGVTSNSATGDDSDSDANGVAINGAPYAVINLTTPAAGVNNSYDFGFVPSPVGALQVNKTVNGAAAPAGWQFTLSSANCVLPPSLTNPITTTNGAGGSVTFANLLVKDGSGAACQYQVTEKSQTGWLLNYATSDPLTGIKVTANSTTAVAVINSQPQTCNAGSGNVGGLVFQDFNMDGQQNSMTNEPGFLGGVIVVRAYGKNNQLLASVPLQPDGSYLFPNLPNLTTDGVRIEFQNLADAGVEPTSYTSAASTANRVSKGVVRFVNAATCNADLGVDKPVNYCQVNPAVATVPFNSSTNPSLVEVPYTATGAATNDASADQTGSIWGLAYQNSTNTIFMGAFYKPGLAFGPLGSGGIYAYNRTTQTTSQFVDLKTLGVDTGSVTGLAPNHDIGKVSLGDIDISEDGRTLYIMNMYARELVLLDTASKQVTAKIPVPDPGCLNSTKTPPASAPDDRRPWGIEVYDGNVYIGITCSAETSQLPKDSHNYIMRLQGNTFVPFFDFLSSSLPNKRTTWQPWSDSSPRAEPALADFDFDVDNSLVLAMTDRFGYKYTEEVHGWSGAGILGRACNINGTLVMEGTAGCRSPYYSPLMVGAMGGTALVPGTGEVVANDMMSEGSNQGPEWLNNTTGTSLRSQLVSQSYGKATGVGDVEALCNPAPLEIGNRVWNDSTQPNGVQDPNEPGIAGVIVGLYNITGTLVATTTTNAVGEYYFNNANVPGGLKENTDYTIRINRTQLPLTNLSPTLLDQVLNNPLDPDEHDSDGNPATYAGYVTTPVRTGSAGQNDYSYDFGFTTARYDWGDNPDKGVTGTASYNTVMTNTGAVHVIVPGLRLGATEDTENNGQPNSTATGDGADEDGVQFPPLTLGRTAVLTVTATNTGSTPATIYGWIDFNGDGQFTASERVTTTVPAGTNNGVFYLTYNVPADAVSATYARFRLSTDPAAAQPTGVALDGEVEDYPVTIQGVVPARFGDRVWLEADTDGLASTGTVVPVAGLVITATAGTNTYTTTTNSQGYYSFTVPAGAYTVRYGSLPASYGVTAPSATPGGSSATGNAGSYQQTGNPDQSHANGTIVTVGENEANWQVDFAFHTLVQIGNRLWIESDNDGDATTGTVTPVVGQVVTATDSSGVVYTATTDANGLYVIVVPANAVYTVTTGTPAGTVPSTVITPVANDSNAAANDNKNHLNTGTRVTVGTQNNYSVDFGFSTAFVQFGDRVWLEADADGLAGTGVITPIVGMVITATDGTNSYTATTNSQGYYSFTVAPGLYTVRYGTVPAPYGVLLPSATPGGNAVQGKAGSYQEAGNPDASHANGTTVSLVTGEANWQVDFAFHAPHADLHLVKLVDKTVAKSGDTVVYTLLLTNDGPDTATNVIVKDLLPTTVLYQSATAQQGAYDVNTGLWTVGTLAVNSNVTLTITVKIR